MSSGFAMFLQTCCCICIALIGFSVSSWTFRVIFNFSCDYRDCCREPWVGHNFDNLSFSFFHHLYGQHLVAKSAFKILKAHIENEQSQKALVLSFHGSTGTGKTFVSKLIAESFYKFGTDSKHFVIIKVQDHYTAEKNFFEQEAKLKQAIESAVARCEYAMFVFEDSNLMNPKLLDVLLPYVNYPARIGGLNYNRAIYLFISNSGAESINDYIFEKMKGGRKRENIKLDEMHNFLHGNLLANEKPFKNSAFAKKHVVDAFIPFLPLEKEHVKECVYAFMKRNRMNMGEKFVDEVADAVRYFPEEFEMFAVSGCKRIEHIIAEHF